MDLVEVDIVGTEAAQRSVYCGEEVLAGQPPIVWPWAGRVVDLGRQDVVVAVGKHLLEQTSGDLFARSVAVHVGGIEESHAGVDRGSDKRLGLLLLESPGLQEWVAVAHHAETDPGDVEP